MCVGYAGYQQQPMQGYSQQQQQHQPNVVYVQQQHSPHKSKSGGILGSNKGKMAAGKLVYLYIST